MGSRLERSKIANDLLTRGAGFGRCLGGPCVSIVVFGAFLALRHGLLGAVVTCLLALPTMLADGIRSKLSTRPLIAAVWYLGQDLSRPLLLFCLGTLAGDLYSRQEARQPRLDVRMR